MALTLTTVIVGTAVAAVVLTALTQAVFKSLKSWPVSLLQNFCGAFFLFSGAVKAVDPLGTAYKMEQYFAEFEATFADSAFSFLAPLFPWLGNYTVGFSVIMIVLEIVLGIMLVTGTWRKFTAWLFFIIVLFFTFLTGFTYLTGYVPSGVNFFDFGGWGPYVTTNMKVTDCGCFGDFLKLEPKTSFLKDIFLLFPAVLFLVATKKMHQWFTPTVRTVITVVATVLTTLYCFANYVWDIPAADFRPFRQGVNILVQKTAEEDAAASVQVLGYTAENKSTGEVTNFTLQEWLDQYKGFPESEYKIEQQVTEPTIAPSKISEFELSDKTGYDVVPEMLEDKGYTFFIVAYKLKGEQEGTRAKSISKKVMVIDSVGTPESVFGNVTWLYDTTMTTVTEEIQVPAFKFDDDYLAKWTESIQPVMTDALAAGHKVIAATKYNDPDMIEALREQIGAEYDFLQGDDIMLKTIIRSNPGVLLLKDGVILDKWHYRKLPSFSEIKSAQGM